MSRKSWPSHSQAAMAKLRWIMWTFVFTTFIYMMYMLHKLDKSVSFLVSDRQILPYDVALSKRQPYMQQFTENAEDALELTLKKPVTDDEKVFDKTVPGQLGSVSITVLGISGNQSNTTINKLHEDASDGVEQPLIPYVITSETVNFTLISVTTTQKPLINPAIQTTKQPEFASNPTVLHQANENLKKNDGVTTLMSETQRSSQKPKSDNSDSRNTALPQSVQNIVEANKNGSQLLSSAGIKPTVNFSVDTPGCKIPKLDPFDPSMADLLMKVTPINCLENGPPLLFMKGNKIFINASAVNHYGNVSCHYQPIQRVDDDHAILTNLSFPINGEAVVNTEFVKAMCHIRSNPSSPAVYMDYFPFIIKKQSVENRYNALKKSFPNQKEKLSIILLGLDSTSRNQFLRHLPKTLAYLRNNITSIDLQGYNKVGTNTYPNMMPLLSGYHVTELPNIELVHADVLPLVWKNFSLFGYRSQYGEDVPSVTLFNYGKKGFKEEPADYYLRPYSKMIEGTPYHLTKWGCLGSRLETAVILKWTEDFFDAFPQDPLFSFVFFTRLSHENFSTLAYSDEPIVEFFQHLQEKGHLNRSVVFVFGDHGYRFGEARNRYVGRLEEKLPAMFITLPDWFANRYPQMYRNLKSNERKLTTPFDVFETLINFLNFTGEERKFEPKSRGFSLLSPIPSNRTCEDAAINAQWCSCTDWKRVDIKNEHVVQSAGLLIERINNLTLPRRQVCAEVTLDSVTDAHAHQVALGESWSKDVSTHYQVVFRVKPSGGLFEGTVWHNNMLSTVSVDGIVDRLNLYGNQSACVNDASLKPFCYCR